MKHVETKAGFLYQAAKFAELPGILHGFGTRHATLEDYLDHFGRCAAIVPRTKQTHSNQVHVLDEDTPSLLEGDAFITSSRERVCFIRTADCVPLLICDPTNRAVGAVHAGWRGLLSNVVGTAIEKMQSTFGSKPELLLAAIGPSICPNCYKVGRDVIEIFEKNGFADHFWRYQPGEKTFSFDLTNASKMLLMAAGIKEDNISTLPLCTSCQPSNFVSYRRDKKSKSRQVNFILIK